MILVSSVLLRAETSQISLPPSQGKLRFDCDDEFSVLFVTFFCFTSGDGRHLNGIIPLQILDKDILLIHYYRCPLEIQLN